MSMAFRLAGLMVVCQLLIAAPLRAEVIISEIMYNPDSSEGRPQDRLPNLVEWVELYNTGPKVVDLSGWYLQDEDGITAPLPNRTSIKPGQAIVLIPGDQTVEAFRAAWGEGYDVYPLNNWSSPGIGGLANTPSETNEILTLRDGRGRLIDEVNYDDDDPWPTDNPDGPSIYLVPAALNATGNDKGANWRRSEVDKRGARANQETEIYNGQDVGSPGVVFTPEMDEKQKEAEADDGDDTENSDTQQ